MRMCFFSLQVVRWLGVWVENHVFQGLRWILQNHRDGSTVDLYESLGVTVNLHEWLNVDLNESLGVTVDWYEWLTVDLNESLGVTVDLYEWLTVDLCLIWFKVLADASYLFGNNEEMTGENAWFNDKTNTKEDIKKNIIFWNLPTVLIIELKRFNNSNKKIHTLVKRWIFLVF